MSIGGLLGLLLLAAAVAAAWRRSPARERSRRGDAPQPAAAGDPPAAAAEEAWCDAIEGLGGGGVLCLDASLRVAVAGSAARAELRDHAGGRHLLDLVPPDAATPLLGLAADARREGAASREVAWDGAPRRISGTRLGEDRLLLRLASFAALAVACLLAAPGCGGRPAAPPAAAPEASDRGAAPREVLAAWLGREARLRLRAARAEEAEELTAAAAFLGGHGAAGWLREEIDRRRARSSRERERIASEAREAGDAMSPGEVRR